MGPDGAGRDGRLRRSDFIAIAQGAPSDYWEPARLGVFDAIIPDEGGDLRNLQLRQKRSQPTGQSGIQALHLECHREHHCGGRTCPSAACERAKTDVPFLSHPFTRMARRRGTRWTLCHPATVAEGQGAVRDKDRPVLGLRQTTIERPGPWSRRPEDEPEPSGHRVLSRCERNRRRIEAS
jgi:hypothetical protein